jgi:hypothetical protein
MIVTRGLGIGPLRNGGPFFILLEDGGRLLLEDGTRFLLEESSGLPGTQYRYFSPLVAFGFARRVSTLLPPAPSIPRFLLLVSEEARMAAVAAEYRGRTAEGQSRYLITDDAGRQVAVTTEVRSPAVAMREAELLLSSESRNILVGAEHRSSQAQEDRGLQVSEVRSSVVGTESRAGASVSEQRYAAIPAELRGDLVEDL